MLPPGLHGSYVDGLTFEQDDIIQVRSEVEQRKREERKQLKEEKGKERRGE